VRLAGLGKRIGAVDRDANRPGMKQRREFCELPAEAGFSHCAAFIVFIGTALSFAARALLLNDVAAK